MAEFHEIKPKIRNNVCMNADPEGCRAGVRRMIEEERNKRPVEQGPKRVLVIGSSTGYGLASRITAAFGSGADTVGVSFEKAPTERRTGTPGWYNNRTVEEEARKAGRKAETFEGDAFSHEMKGRVADYIRREMGTVDMVVYSLASGIRIDPDTGETYRSALKPVGQAYSGWAVDILTAEMTEKAIEPASREEIQATVKVMGGEDWQLWIQRLKEEGLLAPGCLTLAYSYIGPEISYPLYREGTIGLAKEHLEKTASGIREDLKDLGGDARVSINKALVTRASAVIPVMPLYMAVLFQVMKEKGLHEGCSEQIGRLFRERLEGHLPVPAGDGELPVDEEGRIRIDDWEMRPDVQEEVSRRMARISDGETLARDSDWEGFRRDFLEIHGFEHGFEHGFLNGLGAAKEQG